MSSRARFDSKNCAGKAGMSSSAAGTCGQELSGLCELCDKEAAEIECASCGPVRVNNTGALTCVIELLPFSITQMAGLCCFVRNVLAACTVKECLHFINWLKSVEKYVS